jgi:hypothetical protein
MAPFTAQFERRNESNRVGTAALFALVLGLSLLKPNAGYGADAGDWKRSPYKVHVAFAIDDAGRPEPTLAGAIAKNINERVEALLVPLWQFELVEAADPQTRRQCLETEEIAWDKLPIELKAFDKLLWLGVEARPEGFVLDCREVDAYTRRWSSPRKRVFQQASFLPEAAFHLLLQAFSPIAMVEPLPNDDKHVQLVFRGSKLPKQTTDDPLVVPGELLRPLLRRTDRSGKLAANGIVEVPYTYLVTAAPKEEGWLADIYTGTRRPFAAERRARIDQIAIAERLAPGPSDVRFHARIDKKQGLANYQVFRLQEDGTEKQLGLTDRNGVISVPPGPKPISTIMLRSDGQLLAKAPIPAGAPAAIEIPVADSLARLRAQAEAQVVREQLVDVVARRNLMMARIKALLKKGKGKDAADLMEQLDALPSASVFNRNIDIAAKRIPAGKDPSVQKSIDRLFTNTRELLGKFLNNRPIIDLQNEVNAASRGG